MRPKKERKKKKTQQIYFQAITIITPGAPVPGTRHFGMPLPIRVSEALTVPCHSSHD